MMKVLIADDSAVSRKLMQTMLERWGYAVVACADGESALQALRAPDAPRLAILDWVMPGLDGIDVVRELRARPGDAYVFVYLVTARTSVEDVLTGLQAGADDYLTKPVSPAELEVRLRNGRRLVELHEALIEAREALRVQATIDPLTHIFNRRAFLEHACKELERARRSDRMVGLLMIDLDHFKRINDTHGHQAGDAVLAETAKRIRSVLREGDILARFGGEEMVVLLHDCNPGGAFVAAERVRRAITMAPVAFEQVSISVTASLGAVSAGARGTSIGRLIERADQALYAAKRAGRDRSVLSAPNALACTG